MSLQHISDLVRPSRESLARLNPHWHAARGRPSVADAYEALRASEDAVGRLSARVSTTETRLRALLDAVVGAFDEAEGDAVVDMAGAARMLGISYRTVRRLVKQRRLPAMQFSLDGRKRQVRFSRDRLIEWVKSGGKRQGTSRFRSAVHAPGMKGSERTSKGGSHG